MRNVNDYGFRTTLNKSIDYLIKPFYENRTYRIYVLDIENLRGVPLKVKENKFEIKFIDNNDVDIINQIEDMEEWLQDRMKEVLKRRVLCLAALNGSILAGFNLVTLDNVYLPLVHFKRTLRAHEAWSDQITVKKNFRRMGLASALRYRIFEELKDMGIRKIYGGTQIYNLASLNLARKVGFREIADIQYIKILNKKKLRYKRVRN